MLSATCAWGRGPTTATRAFEPTAAGSGHTLTDSTDTSHARRVKAVRTGFSTCSKGVTMPSVWKWPPVARKAHYFDTDSHRSACGRWLYTGAQDDQPQGLGDKPGRSDCAKCWRAAKKVEEQCT